mmetsp:Transcript_100612/g.150811  ORF Transcript_100612/g.150811 Transcript_100612/m.150811 type:complete len:83 (+) Transcript_100612:310-558(+)
MRVRIGVEETLDAARALEMMVEDVFLMDNEAVLFVGRVQTRAGDVEMDLFVEMVLFAVRFAVRPVVATLREAKIKEGGECLV